MIAAGCLVGVTGSLGATIGYALHLRGDALRAELASEIGEWLGMDVHVGRVAPRSFTSRAFADVAVSLPGDTREVFRCAEAVWLEEHAEPTPRRVLELHDGFIIVGAAEWTLAQYRRVLEGSIGHDYASVGLEEVRLHDIDLRFVHPVFGFRAGVSTGLVFFESDGRGVATLDCARLNGTEAPRAVNIRATFRPGPPVRVDEVRVQVPDMPLASLGLAELLDGPITTGRFRGRITYEGGDGGGKSRKVEKSKAERGATGEDAGAVGSRTGRDARPTGDPAGEDARAAGDAVGGETLDVEGALTGVELAELTRRRSGGPIRGRLDAQLERARIVDGSVDSFSLRGRVVKLAMGDVLPALAPGDSDPTVTLELDALRWADGRIDALTARGGGSGIDLGAVSDILGQGRITGTVRFTIESLSVVDDVLRSAVIEVTVVPPSGGPGEIDRRLVAGLARRLLGADPSAILPERFEYVELGARIELDGSRVRIRGTHGPGRRTLMTVKLWGRAVPLIFEPAESYDVSAYTSGLSERLANVDPAEIRAWWESLQEPQPADP